VQASFDEQHTVGAELGRAELRPHPALKVGPMLNLLSPPYIFVLTSLLCLICFLLPHVFTMRLRMQAAAGGRAMGG